MIESAIVVVLSDKADIFDALAKFSGVVVCGSLVEAAAAKERQIDEATFSDSLRRLVVVKNVEVTNEDSSVVEIVNFNSETPPWVSRIPPTTVYLKDVSLETFQEKVSRLVKEQSRFQRMFAKIPLLKNFDPDVNMAQIDAFMLDPVNDLANAICYQLSCNNWEVERNKDRKPKAPIDLLFEELLKETDRRVVSEEKDELPNPVSGMLPNPILFEYIKPLTDWRVPKGLESDAVRLSNYLRVIHNWYVYAGSKFNELKERLESKSMETGEVFDWNAWKLYAGQPDGLLAVSSAIYDATIVESIYDAAVGIVWLLVVYPSLKIPGTPMKMDESVTCRRDVNDFLKEDGEPVEEVQSTVTIENGRKVYRHNVTPASLRSFREKDSKKVFNIPRCDAAEAEVVSPYVFPNGINAKAMRRGASFSYYVFIPETVEVHSSSDSILLLLCESLRLHCGFPFWVTAIVNEQSLFFDGDQLVMRNGMSPTVVIKSDGTLVIKHKHMIPLIVEPNGNIHKKIDDEWIRTDSEGNFFKNGKPAGQYMFLQNFTSKEKSMIRPDQIEFAILNDGTRRVLSNQEFCVQHESDHIFFDVPGYPRIKLEKGVFSIQIDSFPIELSTEKRVSLNCEAFNMTFEKELMNITCEKCKMSGSAKFCRIDADDCKLSVTSEGEYVFDTPESFDTSTLFKKNPPRFFAITSNMSVWEFIREDDQILEGATRKSSRIPYMSGMSARIKTMHFPDETVQPLAFVENDPVVDEDRIALQELLTSDTSSIKEADANQAVSLWLDDFTMFESSIDSHLLRAHEMYVEEQFHNFYLQTDDSETVMPPRTPNPRRLEAVYHTREQTVRGLEPGKVINYWLSHESDFAVPLAPDGSFAEYPKVVTGTNPTNQFQFSPRGWA